MCVNPYYVTLDVDGEFRDDLVVVPDWTAAVQSRLIVIVIPI